MMRYRSSPFGQHYFKTNTQGAFNQILSNYKHNPNGRIVIWGYSYGGQLANYLAKRLEKAGIKVRLLITVDAAAGTESNSVDRKISGNVILNVNFFQNNGYRPVKDMDPLPNHGDPNSAESKSTQILNFDMTDQTYTDDDGEEEEVNHVNIDEASKSAALNYIMSVLPPQNSQKNKSITDVLIDSGIPVRFDSGKNKVESNNGETPFKNLWGVY